ncbi:MAG: hypothetical protein ACLR0N_11700 [Bilophila wadsworthia]
MASALALDGDCILAGDRDGLARHRTGHGMHMGRCRLPAFTTPTGIV